MTATEPVEATRLCCNTRSLVLGNAADPTLRHDKRGSCMSEKSDIKVSGNAESTKVYTRLSININSETEEVLKRHKDRGTSITETVRRAVALLDMIYQEYSKGSRIQLVDRKGEVRELMLL
jgi:hypothetical protein